MKKRILAFLLAVSIAVSMLVLPASAAGNANTAVQLSITLNAMDGSQQAALNAVVTRGALARMLVSYSTYRESVGSQGTVGTLFTDLPGTSPYAPYVRIAVQNGWMNGYTDGSFRPDNAVTLEEAVTAILKLMGYKMTDLSGSFPNAQLNKASELGLRNQVDRSQGEALNYEECALLFYNALTANAASGSAYGSSLGFTVSNGQVDTSSVMLKSLKGPFVAGDTVQLPFVPKMVYRNDKASESAELNKYDVYYYSESLQTLWVYTRRAAGRITAVSPSASAPTSVTVAGTSYTLGSSAVASQVSSLNGGGVGEVVTLLLGMNNEAAGIVTGEEATVCSTVSCRPHPQSGGRERRGCSAEGLRHVHRWHCPHCERGQEPELSAGVAGRDQGHPGGRERGAHRGPPCQRHHQCQRHCSGCSCPGRRCRDSGYDFGGCGWDGSSQPPIGGNTE